jgi:hypothetical protein
MFQSKKKYLTDPIRRMSQFIDQMNEQSDGQGLPMTTGSNRRPYWDRSSLLFLIIAAFRARLFCSLFSDFFLLTAAL